MNAPSSKLPVLLTAMILLFALLIAAMGGITGGSVPGGIVAGLAIIPACWGIWSGTQNKGQGDLAWAIVLLLGAIGVSSVLIILAVIDWIR